MIRHLTAVFLLLAGIVCLAQAQIAQTGAGKGTAGGAVEATPLVDVLSIVTGTQTINGVNGAGGDLITPGSGPNGTANMVMLLGICFCNEAAGVVSAVSAHWDSLGTNQAMTDITGNPIIVGSSDVYFFGLVNPAQGSTLSFRADWTGGGGLASAFGATLVNADQTGGATTFTNITTNSGTGVALSVSSAALATRKVMSTYISGDNPTSGTGNVTEIITNNSSIVSGVFAQIGAASNSPFTVSESSSFAWKAASIAVKGH